MATDNDFFSRLIMAHTQFWYTGGGPEQGFRHCFADRLPVA